MCFEIQTYTARLYNTESNKKVLKRYYIAAYNELKNLYIFFFLLFLGHVLDQVYLCGLQNSVLYVTNEIEPYDLDFF